MAFRKIKAGLVNADVDQFVGEIGNLFFDVTTGALRLSDGSTPGGISVSGGSGGGSYTLPTASSSTKGGVKIDGTTINIADSVISVGTVPYAKISGAPSLFSGSYTDLTNKPSIPTNVSELANDRGYITAAAIPAPFTFNVAADDSTLRTIGTEETVKFIGSNGITTSTDAEGAVTITQGSTDTVIKVAGSFASNSAFKSEVVTDLTTGVRISTWWGLPAFATEARWRFDYDGILTFPDGTEQATAWTGTSTTLQWNAAVFLPSAPAQTTVTAGDGAVDINLVTGQPGSSTSVNWSFTNQGTIVFPDSTTQYSAYTGDSSTTEALTIGTGLSGTLFNGSTAVTIAIDNTVALRADTTYIGTTSIALNRASASQTLTGVSIDGNADTVTNGVYTTGSYANPSWLTSLAYSKLTGVPAQPAPFTFNVAADDSTLRTISSEETIKFIGAGGIITSSDVEGAITVTLNSTLSINRLSVSGATTSESFNTDQLTVVGNRIASTVTNANLELEPNGTGNITISTGTIVGTQTTQNVFNTTATTVNFAGAATTLNIGTSSGIVNIASAVKSGTGTFTKAGYATGDILLDNGGTDSPGLLMYYDNNSNFGVDSYNGSFSVLSGQLFRVVNNLNESGGSMKMAIDTTGNMALTGFVQPGAWRAGQIIKDTMLSNTDFTVPNTTVATSTSDTDFISYSYTPTSSSSYLIIHVHVADYRAASDTGGAGTDSYFSRIKVGGTEIVYSRQLTKSNESFRTGALFPLTGRYTNSDTTAKTITVGVRRDSADDNITITNSATALWMRITEIAR